MPVALFEYRKYSCEKHTNRNLRYNLHATTEKENKVYHESNKGLVCVERRIRGSYQWF